MMTLVIFDGNGMFTELNGNKFVTSDPIEIIFRDIFSTFLSVSLNEGEMTGVLTLLDGKYTFSYEFVKVW